MVELMYKEPRTVVRIKTDVIKVEATKAPTAVVRVATEVRMVDKIIQNLYAQGNTMWIDRYLGKYDQAS